MIDPGKQVGLVEYRHRRKCTVTGCGKLHYALGFCNQHYIRFKRHGDPLICISNSERRHIKLSDEKAVEIRRLREAGLTYPAIARLFDCERTTAGNAARGQTWPGEAKRRAR